MRVFAREIEHPFDVAVQCPHDADAREHRRPAVRRVHGNVSGLPADNGDGQTCHRAHSQTIGA